MDAGAGNPHPDADSLTLAAYCRYRGASFHVSHRKPLVRTMADPAPPDLPHLMLRAHGLLDRIETLLPDAVAGSVPEGTVLGWRVRGARRGLVPMPVTPGVNLEDLQCIERQKSVLDRNLRQFLAGVPANHALLWGPRGTGKSSLVRALLEQYRGNGLRLVEMAQEHLGDLPDVCARLGAAPGRFLIYCDDLSFAADDAGFRALKSIVDGSAAGLPGNVLIHATSNRRHLVPEYMQENLESRIENGELHPGESMEEKLSLSERFGIWVAFHPFTQDQYLHIVDHWVGRLGPVAAGSREPMHRAALQWALERGSRSGRSAWQFARDWTGRHLVGKA